MERLAHQISNPGSDFDLRSCFFIFYYAFDIAFTSYVLKSKVLELLNTQLYAIDLEKLNFDSLG